jgi:thioredoxin-related protein
MSNDDNSIIIRIFASDGCKRCKMFKEECKKFSLPHVVMDANADENQELCDQYDVNQLPHIQVVRQNSGDVLIEYAGYINPVSLLSVLQKRMNSKKSARVKVQEIDSESIEKSEGCMECKKKRDAKRKLK